MVDTALLAGAFPSGRTGGAPRQGELYDLLEALLTALGVSPFVAGDPGLAVAGFSPAITGAPLSKDTYSVSDLTDHAAGKLLSLTGGGIVAPLWPQRMRAGEPVRTAFALRRLTDPSPGVPVYFKVAFLDKDFARVGSDLELATLASPLVADGVQSASFLIGVSGESGVDETAPAGAAWCLPYVETTGANGITGVELIAATPDYLVQSLAEVADARDGAASLSARLSSIVSQISDKASAGALSAAIDGLKDGVDGAGDTLAKLFALASSRPPVASQTGAEFVGEWLDGFTTTLVGEADAVPGLTGVSGVSPETHSVLGRVVRVSGQAVSIGQRAPTRILPGRVYEGRFDFLRDVDPADPIGDGVEMVVRWMAGDKTALAGVDGETVISQTALTVAAGRQLIDEGGVKPVSFSLDVTGVHHQIPAGAIYGRAFLRMFGTDHETLIGACRLVDVTDRYKLNAVIQAANNPLQIRDFAVSPVTIENGDTAPASLSWVLQRYYDLTGLTIQRDAEPAIALALDATSYEFADAGGTHEYTLRAVDANGGDVSVTVKRSSLARVFWGHTPNAADISSAEIQALESSALSALRTREFTVPDPGGEFVVYAFPASLGAPVSVTTPSGSIDYESRVKPVTRNGVTTDYYVVNLLYPQGGSVTITVN